MRTTAMQTPDDDLDPGYTVGEWNPCPPGADGHCPLCGETLIDLCGGIFTCQSCRTSACWRRSPWDPNRWEIELLDERVAC